MTNLKIKESSEKGKLWVQSIEDIIKSLNEKEIELWRILKSVWLDNWKEIYWKAWEGNSEIDRAFERLLTKYSMWSIQDIKEWMEKDSKIIDFLNELSLIWDKILKDISELPKELDELKQLKNEKKFDKKIISKIVNNDIYKSLDDYKDNKELMIMIWEIVENAIKYDAKNLFYLKNYYYFSGIMWWNKTENIINNTLWKFEWKDKEIYETLKSFDWIDKALPSYIFDSVCILSFNWTDIWDIKNAFAWWKINNTAMQKMLYQITNINQRETVLELIEDISPEFKSFFKNASDENIRNNYEIFVTLSDETQDIIKKNMEDLKIFDFSQTEYHSYLIIIDDIINWKTTTKNIMNEISWQVFDLKDFTYFLEYFISNEKVNNVFDKFNQFEEKENFETNKREVMKRFFPWLEQNELTQKYYELEYILENSLENNKETWKFIKNISKFKEDLDKFFWKDNKEWQKIKDSDPTELLWLISEVHKIQNEEIQEKNKDKIDFSKFNQIENKRLLEIKKLLFDDAIDYKKKVEILKKEWIIKGDWIWEDELETIKKYLWNIEVINKVEAIRKDEKLWQLFWQYFKEEISEKQYLQESEKREKEISINENNSNSWQNAKAEISHINNINIWEMQIWKSLIIHERFWDIHLNKESNWKIEISFEDWRKISWCENKEELANILHISKLFYEMWLDFLIETLSKNSWDYEIFIKEISRKNPGCKFDFYKWLDNKSELALITTLKKAILWWNYSKSTEKKDVISDFKNEKDKWEKWLSHKLEDKKIFVNWRFYCNNLVDMIKS